MAYTSIQQPVAPRTPLSGNNQPLFCSPTQQPPLCATSSCPAFNLPFTLHPPHLQRSCIRYSSVPYCGEGIWKMKAFSGACMQNKQEAGAVGASGSLHTACCQAGRGPRLQLPQMAQGSA